MQCEGRGKGERVGGHKIVGPLDGVAKLCTALMGRGGVTVS